MAAALNLFGMDTVSEQPQEHTWPPELVPVASADFNWEYIDDILGTFVDEYVMPSITFDLTSTSRKGSEENGIRNYACSLMKDCLVIDDSVHKGDGERMMIVWKLLLLYFRVTGHRNYASESVNIVAQTQACSVNEMHSG